METPVLIPQVVFEDDRLLVVGKPSGLVVNRSQSARYQTLQDWIQERYGVHFENNGGDFSKRNGIVHRLDKETSGLLLVAKLPATFEYLQQQFKRREVQKKYWGLVHGKVEPTTGEIALPISRNPFSRKKFGVFLGGRAAKTEYRVIKIFQKEDHSSGEFFSLLALFPKTGRTHQLRVHLKYLHHPLVADPIYGGRKTFRSDIKWCPRLFLHAAGLSFIHETTCRKVSYFSPLPIELVQVLQKLKPL